jgi:hypothetical protein
LGSHGSKLWKGYWLTIVPTFRLQKIIFGNQSMIFAVSCMPLLGSVVWGHSAVHDSGLANLSNFDEAVKSLGNGPKVATSPSYQASILSPGWLLPAPELQQD